jgi:GlcNAc-PI de-N-acetylase
MSAPVRPRYLATLLAGTLATVLDCGPEAALAKGGRAVPLTVTPGTLAFAIPLEPATIVATVQYNGLIAASVDGDCASVAPASVPPTKPEGSSVYVATFTVTPVGGGSCTITVTDKKDRQVQVPVEVQLEPSHVYFVAHQDDDVLFMNPDIQHAIAAGHHVTTVYLTAGSCIPDTEYYLTREAV